MKFAPNISKICIVKCNGCQCPLCPTQRPAPRDYAAPALAPGYHKIAWNHPQLGNSNFDLDKLSCNSITSPLKHAAMMLLNWAFLCFFTWTWAQIAMGLGLELSILKMINICTSMYLPAGQPPVNEHSYGKSPFLMGKSSINWQFFDSKLLVYQRVHCDPYPNEAPTNIKPWPTSEARTCGCTDRAPCQRTGVVP